MKAYQYIILTLFVGITVLSCQKQTIQDMAEKEASEYTRRYCPTPPVNYISTDSVTYNRKQNKFTYYCTFSDVLDDTNVIKENEAMIKDVLRKSITESTQMKSYVEAGFHFEYVCRSKKDKNDLLTVNF
ncbi:MAG: hypothetical protein KBT34_07705 [Prevotella sp.]|nr:hypothetical protein [Candidatus Prevotella equi]